MELWRRRRWWWWRWWCFENLWWNNGMWRMSRSARFVMWDFCSATFCYFGLFKNFPLTLVVFPNEKCVNSGMWPPWIFWPFCLFFLRKIIFGVCPWCQVGFLVWQRWKEIRYKSVGTAATGLRIINFARFNVEDHHCQDLGVNQCGSHYVMRVNLLPLRKPNGFSICEKSER